MTKEQDFKLRFAAVLQDLQQTGSKDNEAMLLLGSLASDLADNLKSVTWTAAKSAMSAKTYDTLLHTFEAQGNEHHQAGRKKHAYVIQILAVSLIARTQRADPEMQAGEALLDQIIDYTLAVYRKNKKQTIN
jgi:hypothetical protein